jgi:hypothetical protein
MATKKCSKCGRRRLAAAFNKVGMLADDPNLCKSAAVYLTGDLPSKTSKKLAVAGGT